MSPSPQSRLWFASSRATLVLMAFLMVAAISTVPRAASSIEKQAFNEATDSNSRYRSIERIACQNVDWVVIGRSYRPQDPNWSLVLWYDGSRRPGVVDPDELLILEHQNASQAILATMRRRNAPPCAPIDPEASTEGAYSRSLRGDQSFRSIVLGRAHQLEILALVDRLLSQQVREVEEPHVSLTSPLF